MKIFLDGSFVDAAEAKVSVFDHGLLYGDGVFEGIRIYSKNIFRLDAHLARLEFSATAIALKQTEAALAEAEAQLLEARLGLSLAQAELERTLGR